MKPYPTKEQVEQIRREYPVGTEIILQRMDDPYADIPPGTKGRVVYIDDLGQIGMSWQNGSSLSLIPGVDRFSKTAPPEKKRSRGMER